MRLALVSTPVEVYAISSANPRGCIVGQLLGVEIYQQALRRSHCKGARQTGSDRAADAGWCRYILGAAVVLDASLAAVNCFPGWNQNGVEALISR